MIIMSNQPQSQPNDTIALVDEMVRSLAVLVNIAVVYHHRHPVFKRAVADRTFDFEQAINACNGKLTLTFKDNQIFYRGVALEPASPMFRKLAAMLLSKGVAGLSWHRGITGDELTCFVDIVVNLAGKNGRPLQALLQERNLPHIREVKAKTTYGPGTAMKADSAAPSRKAAAGPEASSVEPEPAAAKPPPTSGQRVFELDLGDFEEPPPEPPVSLAPDHTFRLPPDLKSVDHASILQIRMLCQEVIEDYDKGKASKHEAAARLSHQFEVQLDNKLEELHREAEIRIRRLENIKDLVMQELEQRALAALVVDRQLRVLSMNRSARELLGSINAAEPDSGLARFIHSGQEKETVEINGAFRQAHMIISNSGENNGTAILICLEPC